MSMFKKVDVILIVVILGFSIGVAPAAEVNERVRASPVLDIVPTTIWLPAKQATVAVDSKAI